MGAEPANPSGQSAAEPESAPPTLRAVPADGAATAVEPFPTDVLPRPLGRFVEEVAGAIDCPPDFAAVPMLAVEHGLADGALGGAR